MSVHKAAAAMLVGLACLAPAALAQMHEVPSSYQFPLTGGARSYLQARHEVVNRLGRSAAGRDIVTNGIRFKWVAKDGAPKHWGRRRASWSEVRSATHKLRILLQPPVVGARGSNWVIPTYIVWCESRFLNLAPNSASASGYYQIIVSTWLAAGGGRYAPEAYRAPKWAQDKIAARIWANQAYYGSWDCK